MSSSEQAPEPTMDEILASIRRIISDDEEGGDKAEETAKPAENVVAAPEVSEIADLTADEVAEAPSGASIEDDILELTNELTQAVSEPQPEVENAEPARESAAQSGLAEPPEASPQAEADLGPSAEDLMAEISAAAVASEAEGQAEVAEEAILAGGGSDAGADDVSAAAGDVQLDAEFDTAMAEVDAVMEAGADVAETGDDTGQAAASPSEEGASEAAADSDFEVIADKVDAGPNLEAAETPEVLLSEPVAEAEEADDNDAGVEALLGDALKSEAPESSKPEPSEASGVIAGAMGAIALGSAEAETDDGAGETEPDEAAPDLNQAAEPPEETDDEDAEDDIVAVGTADLMEARESDLGAAVEVIEEAEPEADAEEQQAAEASKEPTKAAAVIGASGAPSLEDSVKEMLRPMLREWLDDNLPRILETAVKEELGPRSVGERD